MTGRPNYMDNKDEEEKDEKKGNVGRPDYMDQKDGAEEAQDSAVGKPDYMDQKSEGTKEDTATEPSTPAVGRPDYMEDSSEEAQAETVKQSVEEKAPTLETSEVVGENAPKADGNLGDIELGEADAAPAQGGELLAEYEVKAGDNLSFISRDFYGTKDNWKAIWEANKDIIKDPNLIRPGMVLKIPKLD